MSKDASRHLSSVLRAQTGDRVCLFDGDGHDYLASVVSAGRTAHLWIDERHDNPRESTLRITLIQGISRGDRMDATVRQAVELGVSRIAPVQSRHSMAKLDAERARKRQTHWQSIMISACEQSGRSVVPILDPIEPLGRWLDRHGSDDGDRFVLVPDAPNALAIEPLASREVSVLIGPESGLDSAETSAALKAGFRPAHLGPRVLRTETAGPAALTLLQARHGDF